MKVSLRIDFNLNCWLAQTWWYFAQISSIMVNKTDAMQKQNLLLFDDYIIIIPMSLNIHDNVLI